MPEVLDLRVEELLVTPDLHGDGAVRESGAVQVVAMSVHHRSAQSTERINKGA
jgi:hypothetical protein